MPVSYARFQTKDNIYIGERTMKKLVILGLLSILLMSAKCYAEEATQAVNDNKAVVAIQKQPSNEVQKQKAANNRWCIIIQVNGKIKDTAYTSTAR